MSINVKEGGVHIFVVELISDAESERSELSSLLNN
jgi:hypothetical protein